MTISQGRQQALDQRLIHGVAWTAIAKFSAQAISWGSLVVLARLLSPADYGLVGMAAIFLNFALMIAEFGIGTAIVAIRDLSSEQIRQINTLAILLGCAGTLLGAATAPLLASWYHTPALLTLVPLMSLNFVLSAFRTVPVALLQRDMQFKYAGFVESVQAASQAIITVVIAALGGGYWALVAGALLSLAITNVLLAVRRPCGFHIPRLSALQGAMTFTWHVLGGRIAWYLYSNADYFIVGKVLGKAPMGAYTLAFVTADMPIRKIAALMMGVTFSVFSAVQNDLASVRRYYRNVTEVLALTTFAPAIGLALTAREIVPLMLGQKWVEAIAPIQVLACVVPVRALGMLLPQVLLTLGYSRVTLGNSILSLAILPPAFYVGARWGLAGVAAAWLLVYPVCVLPLFWKTMRTLQMPFGDYFRLLYRPIVAVLLMASAVYLGARALPVTWPLIAIASVKILIGGAVYALAVWCLYPPDKLAVWRNLIRRSRKRMSQPEPEATLQSPASIMHGPVPSTDEASPETAHSNLPPRVPGA